MPNFKETNYKPSSVQRYQNRLSNAFMMNSLAQTHIIQKSKV